MQKDLFEDIAFCTDFSDNANEAFLTAMDLAARYSANLHIVHVMVPLSAPVNELYVPMEHDATFVERVSEAAQGSIEELYLSKLPEDQTNFVHLLSGYPATEIIRLAKEKKFGLIVMGARGLTGLAHVFFGSTSGRVVRKAPCSVLTVRLPVSENQ
jgi:nucleotide-binding universal stress UspA family protein